MVTFRSDDSEILTKQFAQFGDLVELAMPSQFAVYSILDRLYKKQFFPSAEAMESWREIAKQWLKNQAKLGELSCEIVEYRRQEDVLARDPIYDSDLICGRGRDGIRFAVQKIHYTFRKLWGKSTGEGVYPVYARNAEILRKLKQYDYDPSERRTEFIIRTSHYLKTLDAHVRAPQRFPHPDESSWKTINREGETRPAITAEMMLRGQKVGLCFDNPSQFVNKKNNGAVKEFLYALHDIALSGKYDRIQLFAPEAI